MVLGFNTSDNNYGPTKYIVNAQAGQGTHTSLVAALAATISGDVVYLANSVTENVTIPPGVTILGSSYINTSITGKVTMSSPGSSYVANLQLTTNGDNSLLLDGGTNACVIYANNCFINNTNATSINITNTNGTSGIFLKDCLGSMTNGQTLFAVAAGSTRLIIYDSNFDLGPTSSVASTFAGGALIIRNSTFANPITTSGSGSLGIEYGTIAASPVNATALTIGSTGSQNVNYGLIGSGTASAITVNAGSILTALNTNFDCSNATTIAGSGTINYSNLVNDTGGAVTFASTLTQGINPAEFSQIIINATSGSSSPLTSTYTSTTTNTFQFAGSFSNRSTVTPTTGFGTALAFSADDSTNTLVEQGVLAFSWTTATHGATKGQFDIYADSNSVRTSQATFSTTGTTIRGSTTGTLPSAGYVGQIITSSVLSSAPVTLTTTVTSNLTSISLPIGVWVLCGQVGFLNGTTMNYVIGGINTANNAFNVDLPFYQFTAAAGFGANTQAALESLPFALTTPTTYYVNAQAGFTGTCKAYGTISAYRIA
jgi:hypothetical protein